MSNSACNCCQAIQTPNFYIEGRTALAIYSLGNYAAFIDNGVGYSKMTESYEGPCEVVTTYAPKPDSCYQPTATNNYPNCYFSRGEETIEETGECFQYSRGFADLISRTYSDALTPIKNYAAFPAWRSLSPLIVNPPLGSLQYLSSSQDNQFYVSNSQPNQPYRKTQFRIIHEPSPTCYLKVWLKVRGYESYESNNPVELDEYVYTYTSSSNPCIPNPNKSIRADENKISGADIYELGDNLTYDHYIVSMEKFSCLEDYEPDVSDPDNPQPNGFPDPAWEPAAP